MVEVKSDIAVVDHFETGLCGKIFSATLVKKRHVKRKGPKLSPMFQRDAVPLCSTAYCREVCERSSEALLSLELQ